jgi:NADPH2:quinone reductase
MSEPIPDTMMAIEIIEPGGPEVLRATERPTPQPAEGEVLIKVRAAGVNRPDCMQRAGKYPAPPGASDIPGLEVSGTVVALGDGVSEPAIGSELCALVAGGGYAQYCVAPSALCLRVPTGFDSLEAAGLPETFFTVWDNVFTRGRLAAGETLLVHGGASGIGTTAIQLAKAIGAHCYVTVSTAEKQSACEALGAERAINYRDEDFVAVVNELTDGRGVDVILDIVGGDYTPRNLSILASEGRLVQLALLGATATSEVNLATVMQKRLTITGSTLRPRSVELKHEIAKALEALVWPLLDEGKLRPIIQQAFPLAEAHKAHETMEANQTIGKLILTVE